MPTRPIKPSDDERAVIPRICLRVPEAAVAIGISLKLLQQLMREGVIPAVRLGSRLVGVAVSDLEAYVQSSRYYAGGQHAGRMVADVDAAAASARTPAAIA